MLDDNTPILIGAGQHVEREATAASPMDLAAAACKAAIADCGADDVAAAIDTICVTKLFSDMGRLWDCKWGRSNNPPQSIAKRIGANPSDRIYTQTGGNQPQSRVIEFAADIAAGKRSVVLLTGVEALKNQRHAERNGTVLDWNEEFSEPLEDRGFGELVASNQELANGLNNIAYFYALIEQAQSTKRGRSVEQHQAAMTQLLASFSQVAADNPYAQFSGQQSAEEIQAAAKLTHLYSKRMIAQDGVNQSAALLICSVGKARVLGIPENKWVYLHGMAEGTELKLSERDDLGESMMAGLVAKRALKMADLQIDDIESIDIYSCFPCAVTTVAEQLGLAADGSRQLTSTGGLPYFGGPGNNYSMHAIAEATHWARQNPNANAMVTANGGILSKHASGVYSQRVSHIDWSKQAVVVDNSTLTKRAIATEPSEGLVVSYTVNFLGNKAQAVILAETPSGERFAACTASDDADTPAAMLETDPTSRRVSVVNAGDETLHFQLSE